METKKYKLINRTTKEETLCEKVTIDGYDYYVTKKPIKTGDDYTNGKYIYLADRFYEEAENDKKIIATNNPDIGIDVLKVIDEVEELAILESNKIVLDRNGNYDKTLVSHFKNAYNKSQETHPFSEDDMIDFVLWFVDSLHGLTGIVEGKVISRDKELLEMFKSQQVKTIYYK